MVKHERRRKKRKKIYRPPRISKPRRSKRTEYDKTPAINIYELLVESPIRRQCELAWLDYKSNGSIGKGASSNVYSLCDAKNECPYVLRIQELPQALNSDGMNEGIASFTNQVMVTELASKHKIGPKLYDAWLCYTDGVTIGMMVLDRWDGDLRQYIVDSNIDTMLQDLEHKMYKLHNLGFVHGDIWPANVLFRKRGNKTEVALTDFDRSVPIISPWGQKTHEKDIIALEKLKRSWWNGFKYRDPWQGYTWMSS
jgi:tRNA A-37 threonylcarbamoyl transferase component Bud32